MIDLFNDARNSVTDFGKPLRQFDFNTISDLIVHVKYMAREAGGALKNSAIDNLQEYFGKDEASPARRVINMKQEFSTDWHRFLHPENAADGNVLNFALTPDLFPFRDQLHLLKINSIDVIARCTEGASYSLSSLPTTDNPAEAQGVLFAHNLLLTPKAEFGNLHHDHWNSASESIELDFSKEINWNLKIASPTANNLVEGELRDLYLVLGYEWG